jgi:hypothetical protein
VVVGTAVQSATAIPTAITSGKSNRFHRPAIAVALLSQIFSDDETLIESGNSVNKDKC